jgi:hypothetical protein
MDYLAMPPFFLAKTDQSPELASRWSQRGAMALD